MHVISILKSQILADIQTAVMSSSCSAYDASLNMELSELNGRDMDRQQQKRVCFFFFFFKMPNSSRIINSDALRFQHFPLLFSRIRSRCECTNVSNDLQLTFAVWAHQMSLQLKSN